MLVRAVAFPDSPRPGYAVVVDLLVNDSIRQQLRADTGVELKSVTAVSGLEAQDAKPLAGRDGGDQRPLSLGASGLLSNLRSLMEFRDWSTGAPAR